MLASLVSSARPRPPLMPPVTARLIWHATPCTFGSSKPSTAIRSLGPSQWKFVLTWPVVPRSGRLHIQTTTRSISTNRTTPILRMVYPSNFADGRREPNVNGNSAVLLCGDRQQGCTVAEKEESGSKLDALLERIPVLDGGGRRRLTAGTITLLTLLLAFSNLGSNGTRLWSQRRE